MIQALRNNLKVCKEKVSCGENLWRFEISSNLRVSDLRTALLEFHADQLEDSKRVEFLAELKLLGQEGIFIYVSKNPNPYQFPRS